MANRTLADLALRDEGVAVLGIARSSGHYTAAPNWSTEASPGDTLILYGHTDRIREIDSRPAGSEGDVQHEAAVAENREAKAETVSSASGETSGFV